MYTARKQWESGRQEEQQFDDITDARLWLHEDEDAIDAPGITLLDADGQVVDSA